MKKLSNSSIVASINAHFNAEVLTEAKSLNSCASIYASAAIKLHPETVRAWFGDITQEDLREKLKNRAFADAAARCGLSNGVEVVPVVWCEVATKERTNGAEWVASDFAKILQDGGGVGERVGIDERVREKTRKEHEDRVTLVQARNEDGTAKLDKKGAPVMLRKMARVEIPVKYDVKEYAYKRKKYTLEDVARAFNNLCEESSAEILKNAIAERTAKEGATISNKKELKRK